MALINYLVKGHTSWKCWRKKCRPQAPRVRGGSRI